MNYFVYSFKRLQHTNIGNIVVVKRLSPRGTLQSYTSRKMNLIIKNTRTEK